MTTPQAPLCAIEALFSQPPTLPAVAALCAQTYLDQHFAPLALRATQVRVGDQPLAHWLMQRLAAAAPVHLVEGVHTGVQRVRELQVPSGLSLGELEALINHCGRRLLSEYAEQLQAFWRATDAQGLSRWRRLAVALSGLWPPAPEGATFATVHVRCQDRAPHEAHMLALLISRQAGQLLLLSPASGVHRLAQLDDAQALLPAAMDAPCEAPLAWFTQPVLGEPFEALAASYLAQQLREIARIDRRSPGTVAHYQALLSHITDPRRWFINPLSPWQQRLRDELPLWLLHASADDSLAYARLLQALAQAAPGHFLQGIAPIRPFADARLQACLKRHPQAAQLAAAQIQLRFDRVIAAAVPLPGGFIAGEIDPVTLSLTDLALENLGGFPHVAKAITVNGKPAPAGLTFELLKACVTAVDIGQAYPQLLKSKLQDDPVEVTRRLRLFSEQLRIQLPMLALELKIKGQHGVTEAGFRRVRAAVQATPTGRRLDGQAMALWPLAFKAGEQTDAVLNMFVIGPYHGQDGPHLLYRPLSDTPLLEFATLGALLDAIRRAGPLQDDVLAWIAPRRQAVYAHGGFQEPHVRHFQQGDEFATYDKPPPVQLAKTVAEGDPARQVFTATVSALVTLADRQSVSNAEQRWGLLKAGGWLLFGLLLPYLRGPLMLGGWLLQLADSLQQDVAALHGDDEQARRAALMDLLTNLMLVLVHQANPRQAPPGIEAAPSVAASRWVAVAAPLNHLAPGSWANARNTLTADLQARIRHLSVHTAALPVEPGGPWQGLMRDPALPERWQARVGEQRFWVTFEEGRARVISADGSALGPWLKPLGGGRWDFDLQLRLLGGADREPARQGASKASLEADYRQVSQDRARANVAMAVARELASKPVGQIDEQQRAQARESYVRHLKDKVHFALLELQLLRRLRDLGPRARYEEDLCQVLESVILTTRLLDAHTRTQMLASNERLRPVFDQLTDESADEAQADINQQAHARLSLGMRELAAIHDDAIHWRTLEQRYLDQLGQVPKYGRDRARALSSELPARPSIIDLQTLQLNTLWGIAIDVAGPPLDDDFFAGMSQTINRARWAGRSQADLGQLSSSAVERIELLESIQQVYAQTDDRIEFWQAMAPDKFDLDYLQKLRDLLEGLRYKVDRQLSELLQPEVDRPPVRPAPGPRRKKIIRMRNRDLLVAQVSEPTLALPGETAEVRDAGGALIGSFTEAEDGVWDAATQPRTPQADQALGNLMKKGEALLGAVDKAIASVEAMVEKAHDPASLQALLESEARTRQWAADSLGRTLHDLQGGRLAAVQQANARALQSRLQAAVDRLHAAGLQARLRSTRHRPISQDDLAFLHSQHEVRISRQGARVALKGRRDDYLQVYRVSDVRTDKALCYAHFHYTRSQGPDDHFTAAHLKSPEQERLGRVAQGEAEAQAFARMRLGQTGRVRQTLEIRRAQIQLPLARRLFFSVD